MYQNILHNKTWKETLVPAVLNSYSVVFFLDNKLLAVVIMVTTFLNFFAGLSGFLAVLLAVLVANKLGFDKYQLKSGVLSFNALLTGLGLGTFFDPGVVYFSLLALASLLSLLLSVSLGGFLFKKGLPFLSVPFILSFWVIFLPSSFYENLGLMHRSVTGINEISSNGGNVFLNLFQNIDSLEINQLLAVYLRSLSSIFFQNNLITGALIAVALLFSSRIFFSLSILGLLTAFLLAQVSGSEVASITYYNIGANYMMVAFAIGGFFLIPSKSSYLWSVLLIPLTSVVLLFSINLLDYFQLPVFSLPFSLVTILFLNFLKQRPSEKSLIMTPLQHYSPETNLYTYMNNKERYARFLYFPLHTPFWGEWTVTQGYSGEFTHKGDWGKALDFMILDSEKKTYKTTGLTCDDYYCYGKPVVAPADGVVEGIYDNIDDNEIGEVNTTNNWGNSIVICHMPGVYTQLSHLKKGSFRVAKGSFVKRGDVLASCGNSGRSPEPHLHFQVQSTSILGSRTIEYPISYYNKYDTNSKELRQFTVPEQGEIVSDISPDRMLQNAFDIIPNSMLAFKYKNSKGQELTEHWDALTDAYNYKYLHCRETDSSAYYTYDQGMFYFTAFYGTKKSLLHYFYLSAYKVSMAELTMGLEDRISFNELNNMWLMSWLNDFLAPFANLTHVRFNIRKGSSDHEVEATMIDLQSEVCMESFGKSRKLSESSLTVRSSGLSAFTYKSGNDRIEAVCINE